MTLSAAKARANIPPIVLLVEDDADTREMYSLFLETSGLSCTTVRAADEAIRSVEETRPSVIVTDFMLGAGPSGADLIYTVKSSPSTAHIPIIVLSGRAIEELPESTRQQADALLLKPVNPDELLERIRETIATSANLPLRAKELRDRSARAVRRAKQFGDGTS